MQKADSEEFFPMLSTPLKQMYDLRKEKQYTCSQPPVDMDLDHADDPLAMADWSPQSNNTFMEFALQQQRDNFTFMLGSI